MSCPQRVALPTELSRSPFYNCNQVKNRIKLCPSERTTNMHTTVPFCLSLAVAYQKWRHWTISRTNPCACSKPHESSTVQNGRERNKEMKKIRKLKQVTYWTKSLTRKGRKGRILDTKMVININSIKRGKLAINTSKTWRVKSVTNIKNVLRGKPVTKMKVSEAASQPLTWRTREEGSPSLTWRTVEKTSQPLTWRIYEEASQPLTWRTCEDASLSLTWRICDEICSLI
jgi:hypothetical protein